MTVNIPTHFVQQYTDNVAHLLQTKGGKFRSLVTEASHTGESAVAVDQFGSVRATEVTSRFAPMGRVDAATDRRWVYPIDFEVPQMVDSFDKLRLMIDPTSYLAQAAVEAFGVAFDETIADAFFGDAKTGKSGGTTTTFDTTNHRVDAAVGAAADTGLNVDKILAAIEILEDANVDVEREQPILALTPKQHGDLLRQTQIINTDYFSRAGAPVLVEGRIKEFAGCKIVVSNLVPSNSSYRLCPMWVRSGMHLGIWSDVTSRVDERADKSGVPYQIYSKATIGATRLEEGRVVQIECTE